jgi:hypothetical protein
MLRLEIDDPRDVAGRFQTGIAGGVGGVFAESISVKVPLVPT